MNKNVNSDEVTYEMMTVSLEKKIKELKSLLDLNKQLVEKVVNKLIESSNMIDKYKEKYGEL